MKNSNIFLASAALVFLIHAGLYALPTCIVSVDKATGRPGDTITFTVEVKDTAGYEIKSISASLRGGGLGESGEYCRGINVEDGDKWIAKSGLFTLRGKVMYYLPDGDDKGNMVQDYIEISGWEKTGGYRHPGQSVTADELERIQKKIKIPGHPMEVAWDASKSKYVNYIPG